MTFYSCFECNICPVSIIIQGVALSVRMIAWIWLVDIILMLVNIVLCNPSQNECVSRVILWRSFMQSNLQECRWAWLISRDLWCQAEGMLLELNLMNKGFSIWCVLGVLMILSNIKKVSIYKNLLINKRQNCIKGLGSTRL